jgi:uncharacterized protein YjbI with pentapeptide repeats
MKISKRKLRQIIKEELEEDENKLPQEQVDILLNMINSRDEEQRNQAFEIIKTTGLQGADLKGANLRFTKLDHINLSGADLSGADLYYAFLRDADLTGAKLTDADLSNSLLNRADLTGADLTGADLNLTRLSGADLSGVNLTGAKNLESSVHYRTYYNKETIWPVGFDPTKQTKYKIFIFKEDE